MTRNKINIIKLTLIVFLGVLLFVLNLFLGSVIIPFTELLNVIFKPLVKNNSFEKDIVDREKKTVIDRINSLINDKRAYAQMRCNEEVCKNDVYALTRFGTKDTVNEIDEKNLFSHYENIISSSQIVSSINIK